MTDKYVLGGEDGHTPLPVEDLLEWARWYEAEKGRRTVALTETESCWISTVFLGLDHSFGMAGPPLLFETMVFGKDGAEDCERCSTWDEAVAQHNEIVRRYVRPGQR